MVSEIQIKANQRNSKLGGVKTEEGKEIVKFNALDHGILRQTLTSYEKGFYLEIYADLIKQYEPVTVFEKIIIERITIYYLKLFRVQKAEQEYMQATINPRRVKMTGMVNPHELYLKEEVVNEGYVPQITDENIQKLADVFSRYEITLENRLYKAFHELERAIMLRTGKLPPPTLNIFQMGSFSENT